MAKEFRFPDVGEGITEGEIVRWLVKEGDEVQADQTLAEIETDKAIVEMRPPTRARSSNSISRRRTWSRSGRRW
jgi:pyruvate dehydrogenase E2 component (dihydrolipoamide acetyltransferase)